LENPVENVIIGLVNRDQARLPLIGARKDASGIVGIGVGGNLRSQASSNKGFHYLL